MFTDEANDEIEDLINSKKYFLNLDGSNVKSSANDCIMALYALTNVLEADKKKLKNPTFG